MESTTIFLGKVLDTCFFLGLTSESLYIFIQVCIKLTRVLIPMLIHENCRQEFVAENAELVFIKVHKVNAGVSKNLIQLLARTHKLISIQIKLITPLVNRQK